MVIFIDESGTHKQSGHATTVIVYIKIPDLEKTDSTIRSAEERLNITAFHWGEERWAVREKFLSEIIGLDFKAKAAIFENPIHPEMMVEYVFRHLITEADIKRIFIDGKKPKWYELKLKKILRDRKISVKTLKTVRSESSPGIQLADCLAGLLRRYYERPEDLDVKKWYRKLKREKKLIMELQFATGAVEEFLKRN